MLEHTKAERPQAMVCSLLTGWLVPPLPPALTLRERFINYYVEKHKVVVGYKWLEWRLNTLQQKPIEFDPPVKDNVDELKKHINAHIRGVAANSSPVSSV